MMAGCHSYVLFFCLAVAASLVHAQSQSGFISIDCGIEVSSYVDKFSGINYTSDAGYIDTGINKIVPLNSRGDNFSEKYYNLRSFPNGTRNCYTLKPVVKRNKYLVRAHFVYGNYDGVDTPPKFDLYIGVNLWSSVDAAKVYRKETIVVASDNYMFVCLVNTGQGTPFISTLELRPLPNSTYTLVNESQSLRLYQSRLNYGSNEETRFPGDLYDRMWFPPTYVKGWANISTTSQVNMAANDAYQTPSAVLQTAITTDLSSNIDFSISASLIDEIYVFIHFAELQQLKANESREFDVFLNNKLWVGGFSPRYLWANNIFTVRSGAPLPSYNFSIRATNKSTLPPILNALEVYSLKRLEALPTAEGDVNAILDIKTSYGVVRNWMGDACAPAAYMWEGLSCYNDTSQRPRVIAINLTSSGLTGGIPASIANLTAITSLDLSNNNLTGKIPDFLADLPSLHLLNLMNNQFTGSVPSLLYQRSVNGSLLLRVDGNPNLCVQGNSCETKRKTRIVVPIIIAAAVTLMVLLLLAILAWRIKRRKQPSGSNSFSVKRRKEDPSSHLLKHQDGLQQQSRQFTFSQILNITSNFERAIGKGGFGTVYHGHLGNHTEVAVKMLSESSFQGAKEFQAEALLLTRVHHKNLVSFLGYCSDQNKLALVYEYMAEGSLATHLSGKAGNGLSWKARLHIAIDAAQGLEYLHNGCKPAFIHRDVKTTNILLNEKLEAKLADFGLSRAFTDEELTHISTAVAGTPGYLDPEYYGTYKLNEKSDVYSFGVVLLEIITGCPAILGGTEKIHIIQWVHSRVERGDIANIADPRLQGDYDTNSIWKAVELAMMCTNPISNLRPSMSNVVIQLKDCLAPETSGITIHGLNRSSFDSIELGPVHLNPEMNPTER